MIDDLQCMLLYHESPTLRLTLLCSRAFLMHFSSRQKTLDTFNSIVKRWNPSSKGGMVENLCGEDGQD